jgi:hypothetical protein
MNDEINSIKLIIVEFVMYSSLKKSNIKKLDLSLNIVYHINLSSLVSAFICTTLQISKMFIEWLNREEVYGQGYESVASSCTYACVSV